uniref:Uncharacterized protein n=1 Tax=Timema tahoe TaxID=61484 RepID=A0A7R9IPY3_9NEOP|nr:unnamed protein product [Timema tahoe]
MSSVPQAVQPQSKAYDLTPLKQSKLPIIWVLVKLESDISCSLGSPLGCPRCLVKLESDVSCSLGSPALDVLVVESSCRVMIRALWGVLWMSSLSSQVGE